MITADDWLRVKQLIERISSHAPADLRREVESAFANRPDVWDEVESILRGVSRSSDSAAVSGSAAEPSGTPEVHGPTLIPGELCGPYRVVSALGVGGMGEVFLARDTRLEVLPDMPARQVALKCLTGPWLAQPDARSRLMMEFASAAALGTHTHIASAYDALDVGDAHRLVLVLEYIEGTPLSALIKAGPLPWQFALSLAGQIADGLEHAHIRNIIHCDIKPANVMVTRRNHAKILDFGLSRATYLPQRDAARVGTVAYMPPERIVDNTLNAVGDVYSLGVTLFEMLTGRRPFEGQDSLAVMAQVLEADPPRPSAVVSSVPAALDAVVMRALAKDPAQRFQSARELRIALESVRPLPRTRASIVPIAAVSAVSLLAVVTFLGFVSSIALDVGLGRRGGFVALEQRPVIIWGAMSLFTPAILIALVSLASGILIVVARLLGAAWPNRHRHQGPVREAWRAFRRLLVTSEAPGQLLLVGHVTLLGLFVWHFWPLIAAVAHFDSPQFPGALEALRPSNAAVHERYRALATMLVFVMAVAWAVLHRVRVTAGVSTAGTLLGGIAALFLSLALLALPFQVCFHNKYERVSYGGRVCYLVAQGAENQVRVFCPTTSPPERLRTVHATDGNLIRSGVIENVFTELDRR